MSDFNDRLGRHVEESMPDQVPPFGDVVARRERRRRRRTVAASGAAIAAVAAIAVGAQLVGHDDGPESGGIATTGPTPTETPTGEGRPELTYEWSETPPPVVLRLEDRDVALKPWTYCWSGPPGEDGTASGLCADGAPGSVADMTKVDAEVVEFWFGMPGWQFDVTFRQVGVDCPRSHTAKAVATGSQTFRIEPQGPAGRYQVDVFGRGKGGDVVTSFVWTTPFDGPSEQPASYLALVTDDGPRFTSYGVELSLSDLRFQPEEASASVTVTSSSGRSATFTPRWERGAGDCYEEGSVFFSDRDMDAVAQEIAVLGEAPFDYRVELTLDGEEYVGTAVWPRDEKKDEAPNTVLYFDPPLPAYASD